MFDLPLSFLALVLWILAATGVATLPMRLQYAPGLTLLLLAPVLIAWLAMDLGMIVAGFGAFAFLSMFRRPLRYFYRKFRGIA